MQKIKNIYCNYKALFNNGYRYICYEINRNEKDRFVIYTKLPENNRPIKSEVLKDSNNSFINGFKVVQTQNNEFAYLEEKDNYLLPFRYDFATNFNKYGFAMVGKDGSVSWIDKNFNYLNSNGIMIKENENELFDGWQGISDFDDSNNPLSLIYNKNIVNKYMYFDTNGSIKQFYKYDGIINDKIIKTTFIDTTDFNDEYVLTNDSIVFKKGFYILYKDLAKLIINKGLINIIYEDVSKNINQELIRTLKK